MNYVTLIGYFKEGWRYGLLQVYQDGKVKSQGLWDNLDGISQKNGGLIESF
jgi:hypothetical protein